MAPDLNFSLHDSEFHQHTMTKVIIYGKKLNCPRPCGPPKTMGNVNTAPINMEAHTINQRQPKWKVATAPSSPPPEPEDTQKEEVKQLVQPAPQVGDTMLEAKQNVITIHSKTSGMI